jgi:hypothetical protein
MKSNRQVTGVNNTHRPQMETLSALQWQDTASAGAQPYLDSSPDVLTCSKRTAGQQAGERVEGQQATAHTICRASSEVSVLNSTLHNTATASGDAISMAAPQPQQGHPDLNSLPCALTCATGRGCTPAQRAAGCGMSRVQRSHMPQTCSADSASVKYSASNSSTACTTPSTPAVYCQQARLRPRMSQVQGYALLHYQWCGNTIALAAYL